MSGSDSNSQRIDETQDLEVEALHTHTLTIFADYKTSGNVNKLNEALKLAEKCSELARDAQKIDLRFQALETWFQLADAKFGLQESQQNAKECTHIARRYFQASKRDTSDLRWSNRLIDSLLAQYRLLDDVDVRKERTDVLQTIHHIGTHQGVDEKSYLQFIGRFLAELFEKSGELSINADAISTFNRALSIMPAEHPEQAAIHVALSHQLDLRYEPSQGVADLRQAIDCNKLALDSTRFDDPLRVNRLGIHTRLHEILYKKTSELVDLGDYVTALRKLVAVDSKGLFRRPRLLALLSCRVAEHAAQTNDATEFDEAILCLGEALQTVPEHDPSFLVDCVEVVSVNLHRHYHKVDELVYLDKEISFLEECLKTLRAAKIDTCIVLHLLSDAAFKRHQRIGDISDLERAMVTIHEALNTLPTSDSTKISLLATQANILDGYGTETGDADFLDKAISATRKALELSDPMSSAAYSQIYHLSIRLGRRYRFTESLDNVEEGLALLQAAVDTVSVDHPRRTELLRNLGVFRSLRYTRLHDTNDLEESEKYISKALELEEDTSRRAGALSSLGSVFQSKYEKTNDIEYLDKSISYCREVIDLIAVDNRVIIQHVTNLAGNLRARASRMGQSADLEEAISVIRQCMERHSSLNEIDKASLQSCLGICLASYYQYSEEACVREEAVSNILGAWSCQTLPPLHRAHFAGVLILGLAAASKNEEAIAVGKEVLDLIPIAHSRLVDSRDLQEAMRSFTDSGALLCSLLLASDQPFDALEQLERGRAVMIAQLIDGNEELSSLEIHHPQLFKQFHQLRNRLNSPKDFMDQQIEEHESEHNSHRRVHVVDHATKKQHTELHNHHEVRVRLDQCLKDIRDQIGYERFMLGQRTIEMKKHAMDGTIVIVNITSQRSDAILVTSTSITALHLPQLLWHDAREWVVSTWPKARQRRSEWAGRNEKYKEYMVWLWDVCVLPILDSRLVNQEMSDLPRVWWIGSGLGSTMPFHAAGIHTRDSTANTISRVVSSYTPSIKALAWAQTRHSMIQNRSRGAFMMTTMPTTPGYKALSGVTREKDEIIAKISGHIETQALDLPDSQSVLKHLSQCSIAHFACHGTIDRHDPSNSGLILRRTTETNEGGLKAEQDRLTIRTISQMSLHCTSIAYLSACSTAGTVKEDLAGEVIHVASGFQVAGFPHVVGCLWDSDDSVCVQVASTFYERLFDVGNQNWTSRQVAMALREAMLTIRKEDMDMPLLWAPFVHYGA